MPTLPDAIDEKLPGGDEDSLTAEATWKLVSLGAGVLAGLIARKLLAALWKRLGSKDPTDSETGLITGAQWAIASGIAVGVGRMVGKRAAARAWERASGSPPPGQSS